MFKSLMEAHARAVVKHRWMVLLLMLVATALLATRIGSLELDNNPDLWTPQDHEFIRTTHLLEDVFGGRNVMVIGIVPHQGDIYTPRVLEKIRHLQAAVLAMPEAVKHNVTSLAARRVKDIRGDAEGLAVRDMLQKVPDTPAELQALRDAIARNPMYVNALVSPDGKAAAVIADFRMPPTNVAYAPLVERIQQAAERERDADTDILLGGQPVEAANFEYAIQKMPIYFGLAFLIIMGVQYLAFRSLQGMLLPMVTAILSVLWGLGVMALTRIHMDALNTTTPILIMAVATGHAVQILKRYYEEIEVGLRGLSEEEAADRTRLAALNREAVTRSLAKVGPVMITAGLIAAIVFFSMTASHVAMIRHFGFLAGVGVLSALLLEFTFIPAFRAVLRPARLRPHRPDLLDRGLERLGTLLSRPRASRTVLIVALLALATVGAGVTRLRVDNSVKQYTPETAQIRRDSNELDARFGGTDSMAFLVEGRALDSIKDPRVLKAMAKLQAFLDAQPYVGKTQSMADLVERMNAAMHGDAAGEHKVPDDGDLISQYLLLYSMSGQPDDFDNLVDNDYRRAVIWAFMKTDSTAYAAQLWEKCQPLIRAEFPDTVTVRLGGGLPQAMAINASLVDTKVRSMGQMALVIFVLSSLVFRSFVGGLLVVAPLGAIMLANFGLMGWLGITLDMGTATTLAMVTGVGADYEIYMLYRLREELRRHGDLGAALRASLATSGKAVLFVALSIAGGYAAMLVADFRFYPRLAGTMIVTMGISALLSLLLLRAVIVLTRPRFILGDASREARLPAAALSATKAS